MEKEGQGTVTPANGTYDDGTTVTITATPESGWVFAGWSGDANGSTNPLNVTMDDNKNITATFTRLQDTSVDNNDDDDDEVVELPERLIPAPSPQLNEPVEIVDLGEEEEIAAGPVIVEEKEPKEENEPIEELIILDLPNEAIPEGSGLPQTGQVPADLFIGLGGLITAAGAFLRRSK